MQVINLLSTNEISSFKITNKTKHLLMYRCNRMNKYNASNIFIIGFVVDKNHPNGYEVHLIDTLGYIHIFNQKTKRYITCLSARPQQIKRYFEQLNIQISKNVYKAISISFQRNKKYNFNNI